MIRALSLGGAAVALVLMVAAFSGGTSNVPAASESTLFPFLEAPAQSAPEQAGDGAKIPKLPRLKPSADDFLVVASKSQVVGQENAPLLRYTIELERGLQYYASDLVAIADSALLDEKRGWTARGERRLQRIGDPSIAQLRVVLASPATVDRHCARVGSMTNGTFSCWDGGRAMLNVIRWNEGADDFKSLHRYRHYLVSHEFGHGLGLGHQYCPSAGALAPVMMQQTKSTQQCTPNGWPYP